MINSSNPLRQYFRQPAIYITLPSKGNFYPPGTIEIPANGELPVYPMTAIDEITYRTPDALFNGQAVINVIQSCVPSIKDAWAVPAMDVDTLLVAIRIATYGHEMNFESECPACQEVAESALDLRYVLDHMRAPDYTQTIRHGDMEIFFKPMTYRNMNDNNRAQFSEQKILQIIPDADTPDDKKVEALGEALKKITEITISALAQSVAAVKTPDAMVNEPQFIEELLKNCDSTLFTKIRDHVIQIKTQAELQPLNMTCSKCSNQYTQQITLDMSNFFAPAS